VLAEDRTAGTAAASAVATAPGPAATTPYAVLGDWFAWLCALVVAGTAVLGLRRRSYQVTGSDRTA
jgi:apolipoprotein N-acyltransferase